MSTKDKPVAPGNGKASFEIAPPPIPDKDIKATETADVVIVGCGIAGLTASLSAKQAGAKTIVLEKLPSFNFRGGWNAAFNSRLQKKEGIDIDKEEVIAAIMESGAYRADQRVVRKWAYNADEIMDWLDRHGGSGWPACRFGPGSKRLVLPALSHVSPLCLTRQRQFFSPDESRAATVQERHGSRSWLSLQYPRGTADPQRQRQGHGRCCREREGRLPAVQRQQGCHSLQRRLRQQQGNGREVLQLAGSGDVRHLPGLCRRYGHRNRSQSGRVNTGDGHQMGMWIGAAIDDPLIAPCSSTAQMPAHRRTRS